MPNWVTNWLTVRTEDVDLIIGDEREVDFNTLIPMPKELENTVSGGSIEECMAYQYLNTHTKKEFIESRYFTTRNFLRLTKSMEKNKMLSKLRASIGDDVRMFNTEFYDKEKPKHTPEEVGQYYLDLVEKYGYYDWYNWSIANWGCKWNACRPEIVDESNGITCFQFDTPWGCPDAWLQALAEKIPYHLAWEEEQGYRGIMTSLGKGCEIDMELPMLEWEENEDGCYVQVEDNYGEDWTSLYMETVFKKGA